MTLDFNGSIIFPGKTHNSGSFTFIMSKKNCLILFYTSEGRSSHSPRKEISPRRGSTQYVLICFLFIN